jgi:hydroxypyruvate isomerase
MSPPAQVFSAGMCSVTLRHLPVRQVLQAVASAGLGCVEWGGDIHVPAGDTRGAAETRAASLDMGIRIASYGSYFRAGPDGVDRFVPVLATAVALGAPRVRIWAGDVGSSAATAEHCKAVAEVARAAASLAADAGVHLAFEYHGGTLTDTAESTLRLISDVDHHGVGTYWQPPLDASDPDAIRDLESVLPWVAAVHVFSWWPGDQRLPLDARNPLWRAVFGVLRRTGRPYDALLEFVPNDDAGQVATDAATLARLVDEVAS